MAKSGSHLISQVLQALPEIGPFMFTPRNKVNRGPGNSKLSPGQTVARIRSLLRGEVAYANIASLDEFVRLLTAPGMATIYVYRDPRDLVVSHMFYATDMYAGHALHGLMTEKLTTPGERLDVFILGLDEPAMFTPDIRERYESYAGWLAAPAVLHMRFEDLILNRRESLARILAYLEQRGFHPSLPLEQSVDILERAIVPRKSPTFRRGQPGNWREYFTEQNKQHFKEVAGNLLIELGYEQDNDW
jgi:sulfotransferase 6B1